MGLPVVEGKGIAKETDEKDEIEVELDQGLIKNLTKGREYTFPPQPQFIMEILEMGVAVPYYRKRMGRGNFLRG